MRIEKDNIGSVELQDEMLYGIQTKRAVDNFKLNYKKTNLHLIYSIVNIKKAAAITYQKLGIGNASIYKEVEHACNIILDGKMDDAFVTDALQGGAGTSTNMNVNEVIANLTLLNLGYEKGDYQSVHPIDDINRGQSTNDVYPTALHITAILKLRTLSESCEKLQKALQIKENEFENISKLGRTELMDAVSITLGQEFGSYAQAIARDRWRLYKVEERLRQVNIGGTAVGVGTNTEKKYQYGILEVLRELTGIGLASAEYPMDITQNNDVFVEVSGLIKALAVNLMKISNDLRLMNSGPRGGFSEIILSPMQMGSTIMPGKVNPVIPEMIMQVSMKVMANDSVVSMAAAHGEFELNAFFPLIADSLLESMELLINATEIFRTKCIEIIKPNEKRCRELLESSFAFAASSISEYGYDKVSEVIEKSGGDPKRAKEMLKDINGGRV